MLFSTYDNGVAWSQTAGLQLSMNVDVVREQTETYNLLAETRRGDPSNVVMVGAHLDSVFEGAGINDNGSGSAALLEMALLMSKARPENKVRFAWWGAEESGLVGSTYYVNQLPDEQKQRIKAYLNVDMIGSPNYANFIYDGDGSDFGLQGPPGSAAIERLLRTYFKLRNAPSEGTEIDFRSDYAQFFEDGMPSAGCSPVPRTSRPRSRRSVMAERPGSRSISATTRHATTSATYPSRRWSCTAMHWPSPPAGCRCPPR